MKLICFSNNTAGGLLCNLLNNKFSTELHLNYSLASDENDYMKVGGSATTQRTVDFDEWNARVGQFKNTDLWYGTHLHPSAVPDLQVFDRIINVTTETRTSKLYRWLRYYHGWFQSQESNWVESDDLDSVDRIRCLARNIFEEFECHESCENVEFEQIVDGSFVKENSLNLDYFNFWKQQNPWLYPIDKTSWAVKRFDEAEYEILNNLPYRYI